MARRTVKTTMALLLVAGLAAGGYWGWRAWVGDKEEANRYRTAILERGSIVKSISANGTLNPVVLVNVGTQVSGLIAKLYADFNHRVEQGQVLAELDQSLIRAQLDQDEGNLANVRASLKLAQANERRQRALFEQGYVARADLDTSVQALESGRAQVAAAEALVRRDRTNLGYTIIKSPVSGVIVSRSVDVGQTVAANFSAPTLFIIAQNLKVMQIDTTVAEADVGGVKIGQVAKFSVDAYPEHSFQGKVRQIRLNSQIQQNVVTYNVVIDVDNPEEILLPGMTAFVNIVVEERQNALRLPLAALRYHPEAGGRREKAPGKTVYRLVDGLATATAVQLGVADGKFAELTGETLHEGEAVILEETSPRKGEKTQAPSSFRIRAF
ncbi:MAG: efflux RND transporter periplasmic adaptor subunit [Methylococcaceae bacterium]|nr:efflux RND transporter periplasmic adaptor subunit [Methylococcaceae bacterium]